MVPKKTKAGWVRAAVVGLVCTMWRAGKKAKVATGSISLSHCLAFRFVEMEFVHGCMWKASSDSPCHVSRPEAAVSVLDCHRVDDDIESTVVHLTDDSMVVAKDRDKIPDWWPQDSVDADGFACNSLLFLPRQSRKNRKKPDEGAADEAQDSKKKKKKKAKSKKVKTPKPGKPKLKKTKKSKVSVEDMEFKPETFKKNSQSLKFINHMILQLRLLDESRNPTIPIFSEAGACRLKTPECQGVPWEHIQQKAAVYFKAERLGFVGVLAIGFGEFFE